MLLFWHAHKISSWTRWIINFRFLCFSAIGAVFFSSHASALGFGEMKLHSRVGEPLSAEVPIHDGSNDEIATTCFSLAGIRNAELPVVTAARTRLVKAGRNFHLQITSPDPIREPVFMIGLRADCGIDLQRNYVLMPAAPRSVEELRSQSAITATDHSPIRKPANFLKWSAQDGDTLESIAESKAQGSAAEQSRLLTAIQRANPDLQLGQRLVEGTFVRIPNLILTISAKQKPQRASNAEPAYRKDREAAPSRRNKGLRRDTLANLDLKGGDRVLLSDVPEAVVPGTPPAAISEMEGRMLKLETSLHTLNLQVDNLNAALEVTAETMALRQKLRAAQSQSEISAPLTLAAAAPPGADNHDSDNWQELLLSALAGACLSAGIAHWLSRRQAGKLAG